jgi:3-hydroxybutyryl-CoA dehydrogenase
VSGIAAGLARPERVGGFHFFNPVPLMKVVEIIPGARSHAWVADTLTIVAHRMGHTPVRAKDTPGFIVNHAGRGLGTEALRVVGEGVASFEEVDAILRDGLGFRMGPFELLDLTGLDVSHPVMESIYRQFYEEPRFRPSPITAQRLAAGLLGRKSGEGFYRYEDGVKLVAAPSGSQVMHAPAPILASTPTSVHAADDDDAGVARGAKIWLAPVPEDDLWNEPVARWHQALAHLARLAEVANLTVETGGAPSPEALCLVFPFGTDATTACVERGLDPRCTMAVDAFCDPSRHRTLVRTPLTSPEMKRIARALLCADGVGVSVTHDSAGAVAQRVVATIVNIGADICQQRIASPADVELAVTLGLGYPKGPLALGDAFGARRILAVLEGLFAYYGDPRYRPSPWLKRRALLGVSLTTPENA